MLRRFQEFQWGPLNATRLNELVDAITRLKQQVDGMAARQEVGKDMILARIKGNGFKLMKDAGGIDAVAYPFVEVGMSITPDGPTEEESRLEYAAIPGGVSSEQGAVLLSFEPTVSLKSGDIVIAHYAPMIVAHADRTKRVVYMVKQAQGGGAVVCQTLSASGWDYACEIRETGERITVENLYESEVYYGALDEQPECASLSPLPIPDGSRIWAFKYADAWYTMTPTPFSVACTCNDNTTPQGVARLAAAMEEKAASAMLEIQRGLY